MKNIIITILLFTSIYIVFFKDSKKNYLNTEFKNELTTLEKEKVIKIIGLNDFNNSDLSLIKKTIENFYNIDCIIEKNILTKYNDVKFYCENSQIEMNYKTKFNYDKNKGIKIFITNSDLYSNNLNVRGVCYGNEIYLQSDNKLKITTIHEIAHSLGLDHCENDCIMNSYSKIKWCKKSESPVFCNSCEQKLKNYVNF